MHYPESPTNNVIILGAGMELSEDGTQASLSEPGLQRAHRFIQHYVDNRASFTAEDAFVVCSGGYGLLAAGIERPENEQLREGTIMADLLVREGVPHSLIRTEDQSTSSLTNLSNSIDIGYITPTDYDPGHKLGIVSHPHHLKRVVMLAGKLGLAKSQLAPIPTTEEDARLKEFVLRSGYRLALAGARGEAAIRREQIVEPALNAFWRLQKG
jgi:uncharacterized SAM-binding protein YcdF (DUF218 family)